MDYSKLRMKLEDELEKEAAKISGEMSSSLVCGIKDLLCCIKDAATIEAMDESYDEEEGGYSQARGGQNGSGNSYARGRRTRNAMGQYSGRMYPMYPVRYSRDDGKEHMISKLESMMNEASTERSREAIRRAIEALEME